MRITVLYAVSAFSIFAGQSIQFGSNSITNARPLPIVHTNRVEFYMHDWQDQPAGHVLTSGATGWFVGFSFSNNSASLQIFNNWETGAGSPVWQVLLGNLSPRGVYIRCQHDPVHKLDYVEAWDVNGNLLSSNAAPFTTETVNGNDLTLSWGGESQRSMAFVRIHNSLVPLSSRPPLTVDDANRVMEWKFDGNLSDATGNGYSAVISGGPPVYVPTANQNVYAILKTGNAVPWSNTLTLRAGYPAMLDGTGSYSQADNTNGRPNRPGRDPGCFWQELSGPSTLFFDNHESCTPQITGLVFGDYLLQLTVTDPSGSSAVTTQHIGAVATDANGVVVQADPNADVIFGPMIAFGRNPWGYVDERALKATTLRAAAYNSGGLNPPVWTTSGQGTVSYHFAPTLSQDFTSSIMSPIGPDTLSIDVTDAGRFDLTELPTQILLGPGGPGQEPVRICSVTGTTGPQTFTVCYDGRGQSARSWPGGTSVAQGKVSGSGTQFVSDPARPLCPAGVPGPAGPVQYSAGTVTLTPGSANITGNATHWTLANNVSGGDNQVIRVSATYGGGIPFLFVAVLHTLLDPAHITLNRPYPADADPGSFSYQIVGSRWMVLHWIRGDNSDGQTWWTTSGCESETSAYILDTHDIPAANGRLFANVNYSYMDNFGAQSAFGNNFYGEGLAHRALYLRSGLDVARNAANVMDDYWVRGPELDGGYSGGTPLLQGGGVIGAFANLVLNKDTKLTWSDVRGFASQGAIGNLGCNSLDSRDSGYLTAWLALAAKFDPDYAQKNAWQNALAGVYDRETRTINSITGASCKGSDNSWANGFYWAPSGSRMILNSGSPDVVSPDNAFTPGMCSGVASGKLSVTHGSTSLNGAGFVPGQQIVITGTLGGAPYTGFFPEFQLNSPSLINLPAQWPGDSGTATYLITSNTNMGTIARSNDDPMLQKNWACTYVDPSHIILDRPWDGPSDDTGSSYMYASNLAGFGQQPYMLGIKLNALKWASLNDDPGIAASFAPLPSLGAAWVHDYGYEPFSQGMSYGRIFQACEPTLVRSKVGAAYANGGSCQTGNDPGAIVAARELTAETSSALRFYYESNPTPEAKEWGDTAYGALYGNPAFTTGGVYAPSDGNFAGPNSNLTDGYLQSYKWTGFFFGMGMAHQWPAVRLGGVQAAVNRTTEIGFELASIPHAAGVLLSVTAPSGALSSVRCAKSPCSVTVDDRQGAHILQIQYLDSSGKVLASGDPIILAPGDPAVPASPAPAITSSGLSQPNSPLNKAS